MDRRALNNVPDILQRSESKVEGDSAGASIIKDVKAWKILGDALSSVECICPCKKCQKQLREKELHHHLLTHHLGSWLSYPKQSRCFLL